MIRKRKLLFLSLFVLVIFVLVINYLMNSLNKAESVVMSSESSVQEKILNELKRLPESYKRKIAFDDNVTDVFLTNIKINNERTNVDKLWNEVNSWVSKKVLVNFSSANLGNILYALRTAPIKHADIDVRGTQLKLFLTLEGGQETIFKPKWYEKEKIIEGPVYAGKDRYGAEIIAFYLSALLNIPLAPLSVEREISLKNEIMPVASKRLIDTSFVRHNRTCIYGKCYYCTKEDPVCEDSNFKLLGALIFNIKNNLKNHKSPWQRTYKKGKKAPWEETDNYCKTVLEKLSKERLLDLIDTSVFDFLMQNGDRHHYETLDDKVVLIDNGKGLGNPNVHHIDILAPLYQCCMLRDRTWKRVQLLSGGFLKEKLETIGGIYNFVTEAHLKAIEERLLIVYATVEYCRNRNKIKHNFF